MSSARRGGHRAPVDAHGRLASHPFGYRITKDGSVRISYEGRVVTTVSGRAGDRLAVTLETARVDGLAEREQSGDPELAVQLVLAKATGNFKRGTER